MPTIKNFTHKCEEIISNPVMNYAVIYDNIQKRSECFTNILIDEQIILAANSNEAIDEEYVEQTIDGCDNVYPSSVMYFFPNKDAAKAKSIINEMVEQWFNGQDSDIGYSELGDIYIALRHTINGLWVLTYDASTFVAFEKAESLFDGHFTIVDSYKNKNINLNEPFVAYNVEESSGEAFLQFFKRQKNLYALMTQEGLIDADCRKQKKKK